MDRATQIRPARPADYDRIIAVMDDWWGRAGHDVSGILPRLFLDHFHQTSLVAGQGDALAGFLVGFFSPAAREAAYIHAVGVSPSFRAAGLGRALYGSFFELARAHGKLTVRAITSPYNTASITFHRAMGFTVSGPVTGYNGPGRDRVLSPAAWTLADPRSPGSACRWRCRYREDHRVIVGVACGHAGRPVRFRPGGKRTGRCLMPLMLEDRSHSGSPATSRRGMRSKSTPIMALISHLARWAPRQ
jgi:predicted GNAT superfamily acetyltransferase